MFIPVSCVSAHTASVNILSNETEYISVPVSPDIYPSCRPDLGDIRIYDRDGNILPYFIHSLTQEVKENSYPMQKLDSFIKNGFLYCDYTLEQNYSHDILASSLVLKTTSNNFAKSVKLYGGYDGLEWTFLQEDNIYSVKDAQKLSFDFSKPQKYTHYRITFPDGGENLEFTAASLYFFETVRDDLQFTSVINTEFSLENIEQNTLIHIPALKNMRLEYIAIDTDDMFKRNVSCLGKFQTLQKLTFGSETVSDTAFRLDGMTAPDDLILTIYNGDNNPINIKEIKASYYENYLIFKASKPPYKLEFGDINQTKPIYDIENYKNEVLNQPITKAELSDIIFDNTDMPPEKNNINTRIIFNITICSAAAILIVLLISALRKNTVK